MCCHAARKLLGRVDLGNFGHKVTKNVVTVNGSQIELILCTRVILGAGGAARAVVPIRVNLNAVFGHVLDMQLVLQLLGIIVAKCRDDHVGLVYDLLGCLFIRKILAAEACAVVICDIARVGAIGILGLHEFYVVYVRLLGSNLIAAGDAKLRAQLSCLFAGHVRFEIIVRRAVLYRAQMCVTLCILVPPALLIKYVRTDRRALKELAIADHVAAGAIQPIRILVLAIRACCLEMCRILDLFLKGMAECVTVIKGQIACLSTGAAQIIFCRIQAIRVADLIRCKRIFLVKDANVRSNDRAYVDDYRAADTVSIGHRDGCGGGIRFLCGTGCNQIPIGIHRDPGGSFHRKGIGSLTAPDALAKIYLERGVGHTAGDVKLVQIIKTKLVVANDHRCGKTAECGISGFVSDKVRADGQVVYLVTLNRVPVIVMIGSVFHALIRACDDTVRAFIVKRVDRLKPGGCCGSCGNGDLQCITVTGGLCVQTRDLHRFTQPFLGNDVGISVRDKRHLFNVLAANIIGRARDKALQALVFIVNRDLGHDFLDVDRKLGGKQSQLNRHDLNRIYACRAVSTQRDLADAIDGGGDLGDRNLAVSVSLTCRNVGICCIRGRYDGRNAALARVFQYDEILVERNARNRLVGRKCSVGQLKGHASVVTFIPCRACHVDRYDLDLTCDAGSDDLTGKQTVIHAEVQSRGQRALYHLILPISTGGIEGMAAYQTCTQINAEAITDHAVRNIDQTVARPFYRGRLVGIFKYHVRDGMAVQIT